MFKYEIIIYWSQEDEAFIAEVPELPGCAADGGTYQEALDNVQVIIREWDRDRKGTRQEDPGAEGAADLRLSETVQSAIAACSCCSSVVHA